MESEIFRAGVTPGAPGTEDEVKMLLCYVLAATKEPMSFEQLLDALTENALINYFELIRILDRLVALDHLKVETTSDGVDLYRTTQLGWGAAKEFEKTLPFAVREKAVSAAKKVLARHKRQQSVRVTRTPVEGGFVMEFSILDRAEDIAGLRVFAPTREECDQMKHRFLNAPLTIYKGMMALLSGDEKILGEIFTPEEKLF